LCVAAAAAAAAAEQHQRTRRYNISRPLLGFNAAYTADMNI